MKKSEKKINLFHFFLTKKIFYSLKKIMAKKSLIEREKKKQKLEKNTKNFVNL